MACGTRVTKLAHASATIGISAQDLGIGGRIRAPASMDKPPVARFPVTTWVDMPSIRCRA
jgi:hypothetical protein